MKTKLKRRIIRLGKIGGEKEENGINVGAFLKTLNLNSIDIISVYDTKKRKNVLRYDFQNKDCWEKSIGIINPLVAHKTITEVSFKTYRDSVMNYSTSTVYIYIANKI